MRTRIALARARQFLVSSPARAKERILKYHSDIEVTADGWMTVRDLYRLGLGGALVVLSGCDTGCSAIGRGDELTGLARGLVAAGASAVVMSLWPVPDATAREWMVHFYESLAAGAQVLSASRQASLDSLKSLRQQGVPPHPYLWAGFVAAGSWH